MKKVIPIFLIIAALMSFAPPARAAVDAPESSAKSAVLIDAATGCALFEKNADELMKIASTTKILTGLVVLERCSQDDIVVIRAEWTGVEGSSMYLKAGERFTVRELLYGLLLHSGNDAAVALACYAAGSVEGFAELMNEKAKALGCEKSSFRNPHGLDEENHLATARELAIITAAAMENEAFAAIVSTKSYTVGERSFTNHNKLLWEYDGCTGVKTGYTISAGRSLVSCAERDGLRLICVTLSDPDDWADHKALFDWAFGCFETVTIKRHDKLEKTLPVISGVRANVRLMTGEDITFLREKGAEYTVSFETPKFVYAVVVRGGLAGELIIRTDNKIVARTPVFYAETVRQHEPERLTIWEQIKRAWYVSNEYGARWGMGYY